MINMIFTMRDAGLYDTHQRRIALVRGREIYDADNRRVATIRGNFLFDSNNKKMMTVRGAFIYDANDIQVASLLEVEKKIKGSEKGMQSVALWYCFIR
jgi:hypothetical protein